MTAYDPNNIFAKILRGEFPCYKVYENEHVLAFLDIMPRSPGHTLVIPKAPARNIFDITADDYAHVIRAAHKIAAACKQAFKADGMTVAQYSEAAGGSRPTLSWRGITCMCRWNTTWPPAASEYCATVMPSALNAFLVAAAILCAARTTWA